MNILSRIFCRQTQADSQIDHSKNCRRGSGVRCSTWKGDSIGSAYFRGEFQILASVGIIKYVLALEEACASPTFMTEKGNANIVVEQDAPISSCISAAGRASPGVFGIDDFDGDSSVARLGGPERSGDHQDGGGFSVECCGLVRLCY